MITDTDFNKKATNIENKIPDTNNMLTKANCDTKVTEPVKN